MKLPVGVYTAWIVCGEPLTVSVEIEPLVATPLLPLGLRVTGDPKFVPSILNCTVPVGAVLPVLGVTVAVKETDCPYVEGLVDELTDVVVAVVAAVITKEPLPVARSVADVEACTVKAVVPPGVDVVVLIVKVDVLVESPEAKETGLGEKETTAAPVGNAVVTLRFAVNAPEEPPPEPRFTVIV